LEALEKLFGITYLTGESCGLSMRGLYDLTPDGAELLTEFLGGCAPTAPAWNGHNGAKKSALLQYQTALHLLIYGLCQTYTDVVRIDTEWSNVIFCFPTAEDYNFWYNKYGLKYQGHMRTWRSEGTAPGGARNTHVFNGRVE
jgi:hypothetical protein